MHPFSFPINMNGYCTRNSNTCLLGLGKCRWWCVEEAAVARCCKHAIQPSIGDVTEISSGGGHERALKSSHFTVWIDEIVVAGGELWANLLLRDHRCRPQCFIICCLRVPNSRHSPLVLLWLFEVVPRSSLLKEKRGCVKT